ncbi:MAG: PHP domain-containing protein [Chloroflexi bacterium]|nr:PHP domain-containing protein [Chloroflexota bacterium]
MRRPRSGPHLIDPADLADADSVRPPGGSLIDMHAHSSNLSRDSGVSVDDLIAQAKRRGLDAICLTEHNALWPDAQVRELSERHAFTVLPGMELGTDVGHVLVFGLPRYHPELLEIEELRRIVTAEGAVAVQAHPMRYRPGRQPGWEEMRRWFDGVEVVNGDHSDTVGGYHHTQAMDLGLAPVGGSDAHSRQAVGRVATAVPGYVAGVYDLVRYIAERRTQPVDMRPPRSVGRPRRSAGRPLRREP